MESVNGNAGSYADKKRLSRASTVSNGSFSSFSNKDLYSGEHTPDHIDNLNHIKDPHINEFQRKIQNRLMRLSSTSSPNLPLEVRSFQSDVSGEEKGFVDRNSDDVDMEHVSVQGRPLADYPLEMMNNVHTPSASRYRSSLYSTTSSSLSARSRAYHQSFTGSYSSLSSSGNGGDVNNRNRTSVHTSDDNSLFTGNHSLGNFLESHNISKNESESNFHGGIDAAIADSTLTSSNFHDFGLYRTTSGTSHSVASEEYYTRPAGDREFGGNTSEKRSTRSFVDNLNNIDGRQQRKNNRIKVCIRAKPNLSKSASSKSGVKKPWFINEVSEEIGHEEIGSFEFDNVFGPENTTMDIYNTVVADLVENIFQGLNCTIFAYGTTGSGKTYTMTGGEQNQDPGIIQLCIDDIFGNILKHNAQSGHTIGGENSRYLVKVSYLEIYNEKVHDLLVISEGTSQSSFLHKNTKQQLRGKPDLKIRDDPQYGVRIIGLSEHDVFETSEILELLSLGNNNRKFSSTDYNLRSSRSHCILMIRLVDLYENTVSTLSLCDLAGSEKASYMNSFSSTTNTTTTTLNNPNHSPSLSSLSSSTLSTPTTHPYSNGYDHHYYNDSPQKKEGSYINKSLLALSTVISKLAEKSSTLSSTPHKEVHIPYRDSKLTRLLQPSLSGNSIIANICTIDTWSHHSSVGENFNTLRFASRAKNIEMALKPKKHKFHQSNSPGSDNFDNSSSRSRELEYLSIIKEMETKLSEQNKIIQNFVHSGTTTTTTSPISNTDINTSSMLYDLLREQEYEIIQLKKLLNRKDKIISALQTLNDSRRISSTHGHMSDTKERIASINSDNSSVME